MKPEVILRSGNTQLAALILSMCLQKREFDFPLKWTFKDFDVNVCVQGLAGEALLVSDPLTFTPYFPGL